MASPGTSSRAGGVTHLPSRFTRALIANLAFSASMALPAWRSSQKPTVGVGHQQQQDDEEVGPMPDDAGQDDRHLDHPRDGPPEIAEELQKRIGLLFLDFVGPVLASVASSPPPGVRPSGDEPNFFSTSGRGRVCRSSFASGFESALDPGALG